MATIRELATINGINNTRGMRSVRIAAAKGNNRLARIYINYVRGMIYEEDALYCAKDLLWHQITHKEPSPVGGLAPDTSSVGRVTLDED